MIDESKRRRIRALASAGAVAIMSCVSCKQGGPSEAQSEDQTPAAPVARVQREDLSKIVPIPAEFRPYVEVELHAKVSGYLDKMNVDFGDRVKAGQLLATIEVPELQDELNNALAVERRAEADFTNTHLIYVRLTAVNHDHPNLVAQQDIDTATAKDLAAEAAVGAAKADVGKYRTLVGYTQITAPFDGVITRRYVDPGALVEAGMATENTQPLLEISDNYHLRLDFFVGGLREGHPRWQYG
jgi:RND family efflux transporter MFP subunit